MNRLVLALAGLFAIGWSGLALAQATPTPTPIPCPVSNFVCAFSAAESLSLVTPKTMTNTPGQPDVYLGYMQFDDANGVTITGTQNVNGAVSAINMTDGVCTGAAEFQPATITFTNSNKTQTIYSFVKNAAGTELQFILSKDPNATNAQASNSVRIGVCRQ